MSDYDLIPESEFEDLPSDPYDRFVRLATVAQKNIARMLDDSQSNEFSDEVRSQFVSMISHIAEACDIEGLPLLDPENTTYRTYTVYRHHLAGIIAKARLKSPTLSRPYTVELGRINRARIAQEIDHLRRFVEDSDLDNKKKSKLIAKLDELDEELHRQRLGFARTMAIAASIMTIIGGGTAALANSPKAIEAITNIIAYIGEDKEAEEANRLRLSPPPKAIPDLRNQPLATSGGFPDDLDDVPF
ncbi:hypothetical protein [Sphingomonas pituitosa]|uniref:hypothetical protein n=1 Tax=Sphingomonas pituitosa TaxID=99597 RepID=UPI000B2B1BD4|nr:hypothetical protein [Sphingomonas pituitosa]